MTKRIISLVLAVTMLLSVGALCASAETVLAASDEAIRILKAEEGFSSTPYWDYAQWTVGYGTKCPDDKLEEYRQNGISQEEAETLLRTYITRFESELHAFMIRTGVQLNQNQFDALMLFSYNCGTGWTYDTSGVLYNAIVGGATGSELINAFSRWCNAGGQIKLFLLRRRLCEANIYLNGAYSQTAPEQFGYVLYDACGGVAKPNVQGYDTVQTAAVLSTPTFAGYTFAGWFTAKEGGTEVKVLDASVRNARLYARWKDGQGNVATQQPEEGTAVTVTANYVNVRSGPGTNYGVTGSVNTGDQLVITNVQDGTGYTWGQFRGGWVCLKYTNYDIVTAAPEQGGSTGDTGNTGSAAGRTGTVRVNDCLRVRSGPSTGYAVVKYLDNGTRVEILEEKLVGSVIWGKIAEGWISLDYVELDAATQQPTLPEATTPPATEPPATEPPATEPPATEPPAEQPSETPEDTSGLWSGTVKVNDILRVRSGPSTNNPVVGYLSNGTKVTITEKTASGSMTWGKTSAGWISLDYVVMDTQSSDAPAASAVTGTVKVSDYLRVRSGPGTSYAIAAYLTNGTSVEITEQKTVGSTVWGKISKGWISMDYVQVGGSSSQPQQSTTNAKTVIADCLRIRSAAGTSNSIVGYLYEGAKVEILETASANGTTWGRISKGWISMDYVR